MIYGIVRCVLGDERAQLHVEAVVIRLGRVPFMHATGTHTLSKLIERFQRHGMRLLLLKIEDATPASR